MYEYGTRTRRERARYMQRTCNVHTNTCNAYATKTEMYGCTSTPNVILNSATVVAIGIRRRHATTTLQYSTVQYSSTRTMQMHWYGQVRYVPVMYL